MPGVGSVLITLVGITTTTGCFLADWNETHIYNTRWPPHAKFHNGQTMSMGVALGLTTLWYLYRPAATVEIKKHYLSTSVWVGSLYWITQISAFFYPGSLPADPEFGEGGEQLYICGTMFIFLLLGLWLEQRRLETFDGTPKPGSRKDK
ncbi:hypothetical protein BDV26DRAFT_252887 [Aspergillus bertholletiae]|uniref:Acetyltransferase n=1 Tax=Aspergillus bertholletiae TaxID=1226010 RepID=A0A5N7BLN5_9EURO|nr:hypothetical protein BDV26DRAFT_252887 [Aspergillus bertholletiae]